MDNEYEVIEIPRIEKHIFKTQERTEILYYVIYRDSRQVIVTDIYTENEYKDAIRNTKEGMVCIKIIETPKERK